MGTLALLTGIQGRAGPILMTFGSFGFVLTCGVIVRRQPALFTAVTGLGVLAWLVSNGLWSSGWPIYRVVPWWAGFLVLTIAGERLELSRLLLSTRKPQVAFLVVISLLLGGLVTASVAFDLGVRVAGIGMLCLACWLLY